MDNWTALKYNFMQNTIVLSGSQKFTCCIPPSKREAKIRNQAGFFVFDKFTFNTTKQYYDARFFLFLSYRPRTEFFFVLFKTIILQFFTILPDKLHSFNQSRTIEARASFAQQIIELITL